MGDTKADDGDTGSTAPENQQRLKVEDALNYLDQVKYKFGNQPQVYNDFLDIMKEFKSQSIDTPGVIQRVSHLFRGHPELIVGFNTFLPPGYKIEISANDSVSLSVLGQGGGYVVTTVQTGTGPLTGSGNGSSGHAGGSQGSVIQTHTIPATPVRPPLQNVNTNNSGRMSPPTPSGIGGTASGTTGFNCIPQSAFTHSYTSPFVQSNYSSPYVQSAFPTLQSQPVEFNHAINYVNKIKNRFQNQPDKYKQFLEILHTYQKEQKNIKDGQQPSAKHLTEHEVYSQVAKLFENQEDLLQEFGQFLPDATNHQSTTVIDQAKRNVKLGRGELGAKTVPGTKRILGQTAAQERRKPKPVTIPQIQKEVSLAEAGKFGSLHEYAFFDKVRVALKHQDVYENFLRCLLLYNDEVISKSELLLLTTPFLQKTPDLHAYFKDFVGIKHMETAGFEQSPISKQNPHQRDITEEQIIEIDYTTCKRLGASYCAMPKNNLPPKCSGRVAVPFAKEVLNDVWVSFPAWSEDTAFSSSRKTQFEECIFKVEDERFELDVVIETNATVIRTLETVMKQMARMSPEELGDFRLNECLGGTSPTIHQRAIRRVYGDKAQDIISGLMKNPTVSVPIVLRRLKSKDEEWREAQKAFNKTWREQTEKFYLKSLDLQGMSFKQTDIRNLRGKALLSEIENLFDERQEQLSANPSVVIEGPHMILLYRDRNLLDDTCHLILHHVRRQSSIGKDDKRRIKQILKHFMADLFNHTRMELSDDEEEIHAEDPEDKSPGETPGTVATAHPNGPRKRNAKKQGGGIAAKQAKKDDSNTDETNTHPVGETQESRRTIAKRELKLLLSDARSHELTLTDVGRTSLRDKATREYLSEMSKDETPHQQQGGTTTAGTSNVKRRSSRRGSVHANMSNADQGSADTSGHGSRAISMAAPDEDEAYTVFYANSTWYIFLRLHQILCERLSKIYERAATLLMEETKEEYRKSAAYNLKMRPRNDIEVEEYFPTFLEMIKSLLDGNIEASAYEDQLREMFGIHAYIAYTMDKVVANAVRQLQGIMSDSVSLSCLDLFHQAGKKGGNGGFFATMPQRQVPELWYEKQAEKLCADETCVKTVVFKKHCRMTMELLETEIPEEKDVDVKAKYSAYVNKFLKPDHTITESIKNALGANPVLLPRNVRKWKKKSLVEWITADKIKKEVEEPMDIKIEVKEEPGTSGPESNTTTPAGPTSPSHQAAVKREGDQDPPTDLPSPTPVTPTTGPRARPSINPRSTKSDPNQPLDSEYLYCTRQEPLAEELPPMDNSEEKGGDGNEAEEESHLIIKSLAQQSDAEFMLQENLLCQFNLSSYRMIYLANSEDCIYLKGAMERARKNHKKLSLKWSAAFRKFHAAWLDYHVRPEERTDFDDYLMENRSSVTMKKVKVGGLEAPPYRTYNKYVRTSNSK